MITYQESNFFSKLIVDYLNQEEAIKKLYNRYPDIENFRKQIDEKKQNFSSKQRQILYKVLKNQYQEISITKDTENNIELLKQENTFCITTGHQLNLFTGHLYFVYKIISTINLCNILKNKYPEYNFVPVYWAATEDHDFDEINHFYFKNHLIQWKTPQLGAVGRFGTQGLEEVFQLFSSKLNSGKNANVLRNLFTEAYLENKTLSKATIHLVNELFGNKGLVIIDGDNNALKQEFYPFAVRELKEQIGYNQIPKSFETLQKYNIQATPREINLFWLDQNKRERIILKDDKYKVLNTSIEIDINNLENAKNISPNVVLRPIYQEITLPNLCYIGGGGEIAYWLELKTVFEKFKVTFPMLLLRNSVLLINEKQKKKANQLGISIEELFCNKESIVNKKINQLSKVNFDFEQQEQFLKNQFSKLKNIANQTDKSFIGAVMAQEKKQLNGLKNLEKRLLKAEKKQHKNIVDNIIELKNSLFPNDSLQERVDNFSTYYEEYGDELLAKLYEELNPLSHEFKIIQL